MRPVPDSVRRERYEALFALVYEPVQRYVRRRADPALVDDVVGDTLLVLWRRLDDLPAGAELAWCYGTARRCLANALRSTARQHRLVERLAREPAADPPPPDHRLAAAWDDLAEADRELLRLWAWEQLAPREIAVVLGVTPNAVSIRLHRLTKSLRARLDGKDQRPAGHQTGRREREVER